MPRTTRALRLALGAATLGSVGALSTIGGGSAFASARHDDRGPGAVYTSTNSPTGNSVEVFLRQPGGSLAPGASFATGGLGSGAGGSQGAVTLSSDRHTLLVVDSGSNQVSDFAVGSHGSLFLRNVIGSGGTDPTSVAIRGNLVEVLNAGSPNVAGFVATSHGLVQVAGGSQPLSALAQGAVDVTISPDRSQVVVTEKVSNTIDTFAVGNGDVLSPALSNASDGPAAFASAYARNGDLLVADAGGGGTSAVSSYSIGASGILTATQPALTDGQNAACWIVSGRDGDVFVANAGSSSIATYRVLGNGTLAFFGNTSLAAGAKPLDEAVSPDGRTFYVIDEVNSEIDSFAVGAEGQLTPVGVPQAIAAGSLGIAAG